MKETKQAQDESLAKEIADFCQRLTDQHVQRYLRPELVALVLPVVVAALYQPHSAVWGD